LLHEISENPNINQIYFGHIIDQSGERDHSGWPERETKEGSKADLARVPVKILVRECKKNRLPLKGRTAG
jgi:hypothetical protein